MVLTGYGEGKIGEARAKNYRVAPALPDAVRLLLDTSE